MVQCEQDGEYLKLSKDKFIYLCSIVKNNSLRKKLKKILQNRFKIHKELQKNFNKLVEKNKKYLMQTTFDKFPNTSKDGMLF